MYGYIRLYICAVFFLSAHQHSSQFVFYRAFLCSYHGLSNKQSLDQRQSKNWGNNCIFWSFTHSQRKLYLPLLRIDLIKLILILALQTRSSLTFQTANCFFILIVRNVWVDSSCTSRKKSCWSYSLSAELSIGSSYGYDIRSALPQYLNQVRISSLNISKVLIIPGPSTCVRTGIFLKCRQNNK